MSKNKSYEITIFLPSWGNGELIGIKEIRKSNWDGLGIFCPRINYTEAKKRPEFERSGVYILVGETAGQDAVYIGQTENIRERLDTHYSDSQKDFWHYVVVFMRQKDNPLNGTETKYLESVLVEKAQSIGRYTVENGNNPQPPQVSEKQKAIMEVYLEHMLSLLPVAGVNAFEEISSGKISSGKDNNANIYFFTGNGFRAEGYETKDGFVVRKGGIARKNEMGGLPPSSQRKRAVLKEKDILKSDEAGLIFSQNVLFGSPSGAAETVCGKSANGLTSWKDNKGNTLAKNREREIGES